MKPTFICCENIFGITENKKLDARISQKEIGEVYDKIAPFYNLWGLLTETKARRRAIELANIQDGQNILEVAVGTGLAFKEIVKRNPNGINTGIDISSGMLRKARKRLKRIPHTNYGLSMGDAFNLLVDDESVDILVNNFMFDLIPYEDMDKLLIEFNRVLKIGGKLILVNMTEGEKFGSKIYDQIYNLFPKAMGGCRGVRLSSKLLQHGFKIELREYHQQMLYPSEVILAYKI